MNLEGNPRSGQREPAKLHPVFISYSSADNVIAEAICAALESEQIKCWMAPRDVQGGRAYAGQITQAIREAPIFLLILSDTANRSKHVLREVERAAHCQNHLLTFRTEATAPSDDLAYYLGADQWIDGFKPLPPTQHFPALIEHTRRLLKSNLIESEPEESDDSTPQTFAHFRILKRPDGSLFKLGKGGMGVTYKAIDSNLNRTVALKVVSAELLRSTQARQRFLREAQAAANIRHPHVATIYHFGEEEGTYFYAMEFIEGEDLERYIIRQGPLSPAMALRVGLQVAQALEAAQARKLIHRDIKPSNIMAEINRFGSLDVKLIDFGLAKGAGAESQDAARISRTGDFVGSPAFASPEQCETKKLDIRSDIYSLGVTLWYLLSGKRPFSGSLGEVMIAQVVKPPPFDQLANVPESVLVLLRRMLEKNPDARFQTPQELQDAVEATAKQLATEFQTVPEGIVAQDLSEPATDGAAVESNGPAVQPVSVVDVGSPGFERYFEIEVGAVLGNRYQLLEEAREGIGGRLFRAKDQDAKGSSEVGLKLLHPAIAADPALLDLLENEIEVIQQAVRPNLVGYLSLDRSGPFVVREWVHGFLLFDLLRWCGSLTAADLLRLLEPLAPTLDFVANHGLGLVDVSIRKILVVCPEEIATANFETFARQAVKGDVSDLGQVSLKLNPLSLAPVLFRRRNDWDLQTMVPSSRVLSMTREEAGLRGTKAVRLYACLVYELLSGHALARAKSKTYTPLPALDQAGNDVLRRGCISSEEGFRNCQEFWGALKPSLFQRTPQEPALVAPLPIALVPPLVQKAESQPDRFTSALPRPSSPEVSPPPIPQSPILRPPIPPRSAGESTPTIAGRKAKGRWLAVIAALAVTTIFTVGIILVLFLQFVPQPGKPTPTLPKPAPTTTNERLAQIAFQKGSDASLKQDYQTAITAYTEAIRLKPDYAEAFDGRGDVYDAQNESEKAISDYTEAIRVRPDYEVAYINRGNIYYAQKAYDNALRDYNEAISLNPKDAAGYTNRGNVNKVRSEYDKALSDYNEAIRLYPNFPYPYNGRGNVYYAQNEYDKALNDYNEAIQFKPDFGDAYYNRGNVYYTKKAYDKALSDYNETIRIKPNYAYAYNGRANVYYAQNEYDKALNDYNEALRLKPDLDDAYDGRGNIYYVQKAYDKALSNYNQAISVNPNDANTYDNRGNVYATQKDYQKAINDYTKAIQLKPDYASAYHNRGNAHYNQHEYDKAIADYTETIRFSPDLAQAYDDRGDAYQAIRNSSNADRDHRRAKELRGQ